MDTNDQIEVLDWREATVRIHHPDGTAEETALVAISGGLHTRALEAVEAARRASIMACRAHYAASVMERRYTGPIANAVRINEAAHGNITRVETCTCGAVREINVNDTHQERGRFR
jgi:hypothetical protein